MRIFWLCVLLVSLSACVGGGVRVGKTAQQLGADATATVYAQAGERAQLDADIRAQQQAEAEERARIARATSDAAATDQAISIAQTQTAMPTATETATQVPPTPTMTPVPPTATPGPPTATPEPSATPIPPTVAPPTRSPNEPPRSVQWLIPQGVTLLLLGIAFACALIIVVLVTVRKSGGIT